MYLTFYKKPDYILSLFEKNYYFRHIFYESPYFGSKKFMFFKK